MKLLQYPLPYSSRGGVTRCTRVYNSNYAGPRTEPCTTPFRKLGLSFRNFNIRDKKSDILVKSNIKVQMHVLITSILKKHAYFAYIMHASFSVVLNKLPNQSGSNVTFTFWHFDILFLNNLEMSMLINSNVSIHIDQEVTNCSIVACFYYVTENVYLYHYYSATMIFWHVDDIDSVACALTFSIKISWAVM